MNRKKDTINSRTPLFWKSQLTPTFPYALTVGYPPFSSFISDPNKPLRVGTMWFLFLEFMDEDTSKKILESVKNAYSNIADDFDCTRKSLWPGLENFLAYVKNGDQILDAGCGNGRLFQLFQNRGIKYVGCDNNLELIALAEKNFPGAKFAIGDLLYLPFSDNAFDVVFCIAAFHHIPGKSLRQKSLLEMRRVLKSGGYLCMTNWDRYNKKYFYYILKYGILKILGLSKMDFKDVLVPWKNTVSRYYHCFTLGELEKEFHEAGFGVEKKYKLKMAGQKNLVIIGKKV